MHVGTLAVPCRRLVLDDAEPTWWPGRQLGPASDVPFVDVGPVPKAQPHPGKPFLDQRAVVMFSNHGPAPGGRDNTDQVTGSELPRISDIHVRDANEETRRTPIAGPILPRSCVIGAQFCNLVPSPAAKSFQDPPTAVDSHPSGNR